MKKEIFTLLIISSVCMVASGCSRYSGTLNDSEQTAIISNSDTNVASQIQNDKHIVDNERDKQPIDVESANDNIQIIEAYTCKDIEHILNNYFDVKHTIGFQYIMMENNYAYFDLPSTVNGFGNPLIEVKVSTKDGTVYYTEDSQEVTDKFLGHIDLLEKGINYTSATKTDEFYKDENHDSEIYNDYLCTADEDVVFSFETEQSGKVLSICVSKDSNYIVYRYGTKEKIELEFPQNKEDSWEKFSYSYYLRGGGKENGGMDLNYLSFANEQFEYKVYDEYSAEEEKNYVGVIILDKNKNKEADIKGISDSLYGSLVTIRDTKVKNE